MSNIQDAGKNITDELLIRILKQNEKRISKFLEWEIPFLNFPNMVSLHTPPDGSCLFHSILKAYNKIAIEEKIAGKHINITEYVRKTFRPLLADYLDDTSQYTIPIYRLLNENDFEKSCKSVLELSKEYMINELNSGVAVSIDTYCELLIRFCEKNIFVIDYEKNDIILTGSVIDKLRNDEWPCVVLLYIKGGGSVGHYETVGYIDTDDLHTFFTIDNIFIKLLLHRAKLIQEHKKLENMSRYFDKVGDVYYEEVKRYRPSAGLLQKTTELTLKRLMNAKKIEDKESNNKESNNKESKRNQDNVDNKNTQYKVREYNNKEHRQIEHKNNYKKDTRTEPIYKEHDIQDTKSSILDDIFRSSRAVLEDLEKDEDSSITSLIKQEDIRKIEDISRELQDRY